VIKIGRGVYHRLNSYIISQILAAKRGFAIIITNLAKLDEKQPKFNKMLDFMHENLTVW